MSMNLYLSVKGTSAIADFPFQTPTNLSIAVMNEQDNTKRCELVAEHLRNDPYPLKDELVEELIEDCCGLIESDVLELFMM